MTDKLNTNCNSFLGNVSNNISEKKDKYELYNNCISNLIEQENEFEDYNSKRLSENEDILDVLSVNRETIKTYKNKKLTLDEELINNNKTINFLVVENRITLGVILLLFFLIYKYILK